MRRIAAAALLALLATGGSRARAQAATALLPIAPELLPRAQAAPWADADSTRERRRPPWWAPFASAVIPGGGQALQRRRRAVPYLAVEGFLVAQYLASRADGRRFQRDYRTLAIVARTLYSDEFPTGDFEYYESMRNFVESGAFDLNPGGELEPELDTTTFNGFTWRLARSTYWEHPDRPPPRNSPAFAQALDFYTRRAVRPDYRWSWRNAQFEQDVFRRTIQRSNEAFRRSSRYLGMLIANHALSAVDAYIVVRLSASDAEGPGEARGYRVDATIPWAPLGRPGRMDGERR